jgi:hypothetical protein
MNAIRLAVALTLAGLLTACAMPQPQTMPPSGPSAPSGSSAPSGLPTPGMPTPSTPLPSPSTPGSTPSTGESGDSSSLPTGGEMPLPGGEEPAPAGGEMPSGPPPGGEGDVGDLDEQLDESLEDFDETVAGDGNGGSSGEIDILNPMGQSSSGVQSDEPIYEEASMETDSTPMENDEIAERAAEGAPASESSESGEESGSAQGGAGGGGSAAPEAADGQNSGGASSAGEEGGANIIPIPDDIGDGRDDDIVMRQIREAAMKETNPELREKLWDEYRRIRDQR